MMDGDTYENYKGSSEDDVAKYKGRSESSVEYESGGSSVGKGRGVYCSLVVIVFSILTVCVLITATGLMVYYIPRIGEVPSKPPVVDDPTPPLLKGRLPKTVLPRRYEVSLRPYLYDDDVPYAKLGKRFTFDGTVRIKVECIVPTDKITLHAKSITIHDMPTVVKVSSFDQTDIFESYEMVEEYAFLVLKLKQMMMPHQEYSIYIDYSGILGDDEAGFYPSKYLDPSNNTRYIATTQMEGPYARRVLPCFDEPSFKATYDVKLEHRKDMQALANGKEFAYEYLNNHWTRTTFDTVYFMPTYLLAFIVHDYKSIEVINANGCLIRVWCQPDLINLAPYALNVSDLVQTYFDSYLDFQYPLRKQDHIAIQDFGAGAMENWGLITYQDFYLLKDMSDTVPLYWYPLIIAHELAHQWFGNLVTMEWWDDLWLNEGFATYMEHIGIDYVHPEMRRYETFYIDTTDRALQSDSLGSNPAIREPVYATDEEISRQFSTITYQKGGAILWMMEDFLTIDVFNRGIKSYLKKMAYKNAVAEDLWRELTYASKENGSNVSFLDGTNDVKAVMDTWTLQRGYPLVRLRRSNNFLWAEPEVFLQLGKTLDDDEFGNLGYKWYIPLTYVFQSGPADKYDNPERIWLKPEIDITAFPLPSSAADDDWYLANVKMTGYYRVTYDSKNWKRLMAQAERDPDAFSEENKIGLLYDSDNLAKAEIIPISIYQNFSKSLANNTIETRLAVISTSSYSARMLMGSQRNIERRSVSSSNVQAYMQNLVEPLYFQDGWNPNFVPELPASSVLRGRRSHVDITSLACHYGHEHCVSKATNMFKEYMENPSQTIPKNLRDVVYCNGIRFGGQSEWDFAWGKLQTSENRRERSRWVSALTCSTDTSLLQNYLQWVLDSTIFSRRDAELILMGVAENPDGYEVAWDFVRDHWEEVNKMFKRNQQIWRDIFEEMTSHFNTNEKLQELLDFGQGRHLGALKYTYKAAVTSTKVNIRWMANNAPKMKEWIASVI